MKAIGLKNNKQFTDDTAACMVLSDAIIVMLLTHTKWAQVHEKDNSRRQNHRPGFAFASHVVVVKRSMILSKPRAWRGGTADPNTDSGSRILCTAAALRIPDGHIWETDVDECSRDKMSLTLQNPITAKFRLLNQSPFAAFGQLTLALHKSVQLALRFVP